MSPLSNKKNLFFLVGTALLIALVTYLTSFLARGYKLSFNQGSFIKATGLLSATSIPKSASVYINDRLVTATDDTLNLPPGQYQIKIVKDGYLPWEKTADIKKEIVYQTNATLFRAAPDLTPITLTGAINPVLSPNNSKIVYAVASASAEINNGLYQLDLTNRPLPISKNVPQQIYPNFPNINWADFSFEFSPDSQSILAIGPNSTYQIKLDSLNKNNLLDVTPRLSLIKDDWQQQISLIIKNLIKDLPNEIKQVISTTSASTISFSSSDTKVLYLAQSDIDLQDQYITPPPAQNSSNQNRRIKAKNYYVYDQKDDTNFFIGSVQDIAAPFWLPNSDNIIYVQNQQIKTVEYDTTNSKTLFANNFDQNIVFPWPDGNRIVTFTSAYSPTPDNLYAITIR